MFTKRPLKYRWEFLRKFLKPEIFPEAFFAYFHKLPSQIEVSWFRDNGMIIGEVKAGDKKFMTQGIDVDDFIQMVNQSIVTAFNIPDDYFEAISKTKSYNPPVSERKLLEDKNVKQRTFGLVKGERAFKLA